MSHNLTNQTAGFGSAHTSLGVLQHSGLGSNTSTPLEALQANSLGVGFSGSGFLILYFTGVSAVLQSLGIINNNTKLAGSSGGAITAAALCSDVPAATDQVATNLEILTSCRPTHGCHGNLGTVVQSMFTKSIRNVAAAAKGSASGNQVSQQCQNKLFITVTHARPNNQTDLPVLLSNFTNQTQLVNGVASSAFLPFWSAPGPVTQYEGLPVYDGGFSYPLPCPPDVTYCVMVSSQPPQAPTLPAAANQSSDNTTESSLDLFTAAANKSDPATRAYLPLNPVVIPVARLPDIYPGLSAPLNVTAKQWDSWGLDIPDNATLLYIYNQGRRDAAHWALQTGLADSQRVRTALAAQPVGFGST